MAKFCANCGAPMEDDDRVCGQCGTPVEGVNLGEPAPAPTPAKAGAAARLQGLQGVQAAKNMTGKNAGIIKAVIGVAIAVVVVAGGAKVVGNHTGYKGTMNKMVKALQKEDVEALEGLASSISDELCTSYYGDSYDAYDDMVSNTLDKYEEDHVGDIKKISYEITYSKELSDRKMEKIKDDLMDAFNMDTDDIKKAVELECKITVKGSEKSRSYNRVTIYAVKEDGGWKLVYGGLPYINNYMH